MKRGVISLIIIGLHVLLLTIALRMPVTADTLQQTVPQPAEPTVAPIAISIRQQLPMTITLQRSVAATETLATGEISTTTVPLMESVVVTLDLQLDLTVTDTLTATVPSTVTLTFPDQQTTTLPISVTVGLSPTAQVALTPLALPTTTVTTTTAVTTTAPLSPTADSVLTPTLGLTTTVPPQVLNPTVVSSVAITTNLRSGPDTTFDIQTLISPGTEILVVAQNVDGTWYLLNNGLWIAAFLVDGAPENLPLATEELVTTLRERNPITPTVPIINTPAVTTTTPATTTAGITTTTAVTESTPVTDDAPATGTTPILVPTPAPAGTAGSDNTDEPADTTPADETAAEETGTAEPPSVTVDANLRSGPGTAFDVVGGTVTGQALTIVGRNADGSWFLLDNGGWVASFLVANAPNPNDVPLVDDDGTVGAVEAGTPVTPTVAITPTTPATPTFGVQENLYVIRVDGIVDRYDFSLTQIDQLIADAQADPTALEDQEWIIQMTTMITLLRSAGDELESLTPPALFNNVQTQLTQAATAYDNAADLLAAGIDQLQVETLTTATEQINTGDQALTAAQAAIETLTP